MNILYLAPANGTARHRADALVRLGHNVKIVDPDTFLPDRGWIHQWKWNTGGLFLSNYIRQQVIAEIATASFDLAIIVGGALIGADLVKELKRYAKTIVNYNNDDPFGKRDRNLWRLYLQAIPFYDLVVVMRECNVAEAYSYGAKQVLRVFMSADEVAHHPRPLTADDYKQWSSNVLFVGTWMPERGSFLAALVEAEIPLTIYGDRWQKAREWSVLRHVWQGRGLHAADDYAKAIQTAKICLGLLSKGNRDLHTTRSMEIPFLGGLLCAERTDEHLKLYRENREAVFWSDVNECIQICRDLLNSADRRKEIASQGRRRCLQNQHLNEIVMAKIVTSAISASEVKDSYE